MYDISDLDRPVAQWNRVHSSNAKDYLENDYV